MARRRRRRAGYPAPEAEEPAEQAELELPGAGYPTPEPAPLNAAVANATDAASEASPDAVPEPETVANATEPEPARPSTACSNALHRTSDLEAGAQRVTGNPEPLTGTLIGRRVR